MAEKASEAYLIGSVGDGVSAWHLLLYCGIAALHRRPSGTAAAA